MTQTIADIHKAIQRGFDSGLEGILEQVPIFPSIYANGGEQVRTGELPREGSLELFYEAARQIGRQRRLAIQEQLIVLGHLFDKRPPKLVYLQNWEPCATIIGTTNPGHPTPKKRVIYVSERGSIVDAADGCLRSDTLPIDLETEIRVPRVEDGKQS